ncbi:hypothetical protein F5877DRAFT_82456 [Lentinula edodes]|nr:hypothetical protein F5877DRAFT_82456 [Lentinula edodes]
MPSGSPRYKRDVELSFGSPVRGLPSLTTTNSNNPNWTTLMVFLNTKLITGISFIVVYLTAIATPVVQGLPATEARTDHLVCGLDVAPYCTSFEFPGYQPLARG